MKEWIKKCDIAMSELVRKKGVCEWCGQVGGDLQHAHVIPRGNKTLRYDIMNALCLCGRCHRFKWHEHPLMAHDWFLEKYPDRYKYLEVAVNYITYNRTVEDYKKIYKDIKEENLNNLIFYKP